MREDREREDEAHIADLVHLHQGDECWAAVVIARDADGPVLSVIGEEHTTWEHQATHLKTHYPYRPTPALGSGRATWHWPDRCPWDR